MVEVSQQTHSMKISQSRYLKLRNFQAALHICKIFFFNAIFRFILYKGHRISDKLEGSHDFDTLFPMLIFC